MALNKLRQLDTDSFGVTIPKDDLRLDGYLDDGGDLDGDHQVHVERDGPGEWTLRLVEDL